MLLIRFTGLILAVVAIIVVVALADVWWLAVLAAVVLVLMTVALVLLVFHYTGAPGWLGPTEEAQLQDEQLVEFDTGLPTRRRWNERQAGEYAQEVARRV
jgi:membrane protein implicated in regulation of membrane protease activity